MWGLAPYEKRGLNLATSDVLKSKCANIWDVGRRGLCGCCFFMNLVLYFCQLIRLSVMKEFLSLQTSEDDAFRMAGHIVRAKTKYRVF